MAGTEGKLVTVFGATGAQGGSVAQALLASQGKYKVRAVTRNVDSDKAKKLKEMGAEVVKADIDNKEEVKKALEGAYACFAVTNFWEHMDQEKEKKQGILLADAAKEVGIQHYIYSGLENVKKLVGYPCPHFDAKGEVEEYIESVGLPFTIVRMAAYTENFATMLKPQKTGEGQYTMFIPMGDQKLSLITITDCGNCVVSILDDKEQYQGKKLGLANYELTIEEICAKMSQHLGVKVVDGKITAENFAKLGFPGADDLANMFSFYQTGKCIRDIPLTNRLNPKMADFDQWLATNKEAILQGLQG